MQASDITVHDENLRAFRKLIDCLDDYPRLDDIVDATLRIYCLNPEDKTNADELERTLQDFIIDEAREITPELAVDYATKVFKNFKPDATIKEALVSVGKMYEETTKPLTPILVSFWGSVMDRCEEDGIEKIIFAANNANPLYVVAKRLKKANFKIALVDLGRSLFNIHDEIAKIVDKETPGSDKSEF